MKVDLPKLQPIPNILSFTPADHQLLAGLPSITIPPADSDQKHLLLHAGIRQSVYMGTHFLQSLCVNHIKKTTDLPAVMMYRHMLDMGDSISTLLRLGCAAGGFIVLRSLYESSLFLDFLLQDNVLHDDRSTCYWVGYRTKQLQDLTKFDPNTEKGQEFHKRLQSDPSLTDKKFPTKDYKKDRAFLEEFLSRDGIHIYYEKYKQSKGKRPTWYSLCSEAKDRRQLAKILHRENEYDILYSYFSGVAHADDVFPI